MKSACLLVLTICTLTVCCGLSEAKAWKQKEFIITMWCAPPATDENLKILVRDGYNLTNVSFAGDMPIGTDEAIKRLDVAQRNGIKSLFYNPLITPATLDDPAQKAKLDALIDTVKKHPALEGYHLCDEPQATAFPAWAKITKYLRERDPGHLAYINLYPSYADQKTLAVFPTEVPKDAVGLPANYAGAETCKWIAIFYNEHLRLFVDQVKPELISYDHYTFFESPKGHYDGGQYFLNLALVRAAALKANVPFLNIVQACTIDKGWRLPNENELRWQAYTTMAYGGRGISWFLYWGPKYFGGLYQDGKRMPIAGQVARINREIKALGPQLMKLTSTQVYHTDGLFPGTQSIADGCPVKATGGYYVVGMFKQNDVENVFMIVNRDYRATSTAKLTLSLGNGKLMEFSINKRRWVEVRHVQSGSTVSTTLVPGGGKLYKVVK